MAHVWLTELKAALFITGADTDGLLDDILEDVVSAVESITSLTLFDPGADITEYKSGDGSRYIETDHAPILSVTSIHSDTTRQWDASTEIDSYLFSVSDSEPRKSVVGEIRAVYSQTATNQLFHFADGEDNVRIIYRPGWTDKDAIPYDIRRAVLRWAAFGFKTWERKVHGVKSENMADGSVNIIADKPPKEIEDLLVPRWVRPAGFGR